ncbi:hypothetical protein WJX79_003792 [Trebouxia sp. C0005]
MRQSGVSSFTEPPWGPYAPPQPSIHQPKLAFDRCTSLDAALTPCSTVAISHRCLSSPGQHLSGPSPSEVPTEALWDTESVACHARPGYTDPGPCSAIFQIAITYGFTPLMVSLGTSYFRRLAASNYAMLQLGLESAQFCDFMLPMEVLPLGQTAKPLVGAIHAKYLPTKEAWLTLIHLTCIYLAAKVLEYVPCKNMLQTMMAHVYGAEPCNVSKDVVTHLELECLQALDWRLGPVYRTEP